MLKAKLLTEKLPGAEGSGPSGPTSRGSLEQMLKDHSVSIVTSVREAHMSLCGLVTTKNLIFHMFFPTRGFISSSSVLFSLLLTPA